MYRRHVLAFAIALPVAVALANSTMAQQPASAEKPIRELLVGAWTVLLVDGKKADGTQMPLFGPNPIGSLIFTANGRFSWQVMRSINRSPFKSNNRDTGTADENREAVQGALSFFGTYTVDEAARAINLRVLGDTFPNNEGSRGRWIINQIDNDTLTFEVPTAGTSTPGAGYTSILNIWGRVK